jgi:hypothetical protein
MRGEKHRVNPSPIDRPDEANNVSPMPAVHYDSLPGREGSFECDLHA